MADPNPPKDPRKTDYFHPRTERFDVVLCKDGVGAHAASSDDFKRVSVETDDGAAGARNLPAVEAVEKEGYTIVSVVPPGRMTEGETLARQRANDSVYGATDLSKIGVPRGG